MFFRLHQGYHRSGSQEMTAGRRKLIYEDVLEVMQLSGDGPVDAQMGWDGSQWVDGFYGFYMDSMDSMAGQPETQWKKW